MTEIILRLKDMIISGQKEKINDLENLIGENFISYIDFPELYTLPLTTICSIISKYDGSDMIKLKTFISKLYSSGYINIPILLDFINVDGASLDSLVSFISEFKSSSICVQIAKSMDENIMKPEMDYEYIIQQKNTEIARLKNLVPKVEKRFNGIDHFSGLTEELKRTNSGRNIVSDIIKITTSSIGGQCYAGNIFDDDGCWLSNNKPNSWILFDFVDRDINLHEYSIKAWNLKSFIVEGSNDEISWGLVDSHSDVESLNGDKKVETFYVKPTSSKYRFLRITQTDKRWDGYDYFYIYRIEFFGVLSY